MISARNSAKPFLFHYFLFYPGKLFHKPVKLFLWGTNGETVSKTGQKNLFLFLRQCLFLILFSFLVLILSFGSLSYFSIFFPCLSSPSSFSVLVPHPRSLSLFLVFISCLSPLSSFHFAVSCLRYISSFPVFVPCLRSLSFPLTAHTKAVTVHVEDVTAQIVHVQHKQRT